ncbi:MAG TPA: tetratricopeptide repeat protein [Terriglobales bacterium]|nr:tetratricopeptide repeat protein [Terriglobales bacterium]
MNQRFTLDRKSFEQFLAALSLVQQLNNQARYKRALGYSNQPFLSLLQLQQDINAGKVDLPSVMASMVKLTQSVVGANAAGIWLFRNTDEFSCCAQIGSLYQPERLSIYILTHLASSNQPDSDSRAFSRAIRGASHYPGYPNSVAIALLRVNRNVVGAVAAFSTEFDAFATRDLDNLHFLAGLLEQALQKAMQAGYREAVALEHSALLQLLERIAPQLREFERQTSSPKHSDVPKNGEDAALSRVRGVYARLPQPVAPVANSAEAEETTANSDADPGRADISVPGVGVRAALGDVREFTGKDSPFFLWQAVRNGSARARKLAAQSWSGVLGLVVGAPRGMQNVKTHFGRAPRGFVVRGSSASVGLGASVIARRQNAFSKVCHWTLKVRLVGLARLRCPSLPQLGSSWLRTGRSLAMQVRSFAVGSMQGGKYRLNDALRLSGIRARSVRRDLRQTIADLSATVAYQRKRVRIAQRRHKATLASSTEVTGEALQQAGESLAGVAASAGHSTITAFATLKAHVANTIASIKATRVNPRALRSSASAIGVLAVMATFLALQARLRHSLEHVNAASAAARAAVPNVPAAAASPVVHATAEPNSHLEITDTSVADTLHDLTRYEIVSLQRAAEYGDDEAAFQLGMAYETGYYVRQNCSKAAHWVKIAAESGNAAAAYNLGLRYRRGDGLTADESAAEHWLRMASALRYSPARLALAAVR